MKHLWRGPFGLTFRRCLRFATLPTALATAAAIVLATRLQPAIDGEAPAAASPWLALPMVVAALASTLAAAVFWPTFARTRPGRAWIERWSGGRLAGAGGALAGALAAILVLQLPLTIGLARWLGAPAAARQRVELHAIGTPVLDPHQTRLTFRVPSAQPVAELWLRPRIGMPDGPWQGTVVAAVADGEPLGTLPVPFVDDRQLARLRFPPRTIRELTLVRTGGSVPLVFLPESAGLAGANVHSGVANGLWLALVALLPPFVALALASWFGRAAALPTTLTVVFAIVFLLTVGGAGPFDPALVALFRGQWVANGDIFTRCVPSLAVGCLAMIGAMWMRPEVRT
jgi:hypothetical protein